MILGIFVLEQRILPWELYVNVFWAMGYKWTVVDSRSYTRIIPCALSRLIIQGRPTGVPQGLVEGWG